MKKAVILDPDAVGGQLIADVDTIAKRKARELESHEYRSDAVEIGKKGNRFVENQPWIED